MPCEEKGPGPPGLFISPNILLRNDLRPGDLGAIVRLHGIVYTREHGFDRTFEAYVAAGVADFGSASDPRRQRAWILEKDGAVAGSIAIVERPGNEAQLRWFLIESELRGRGLGRRLLGEALRYCLGQGYKKVFLWTLEQLPAAGHIYRTCGFMKTDEKIHPLWGKTVREERYELELGRSNARLQQLMFKY